MRKGLTWTSLTVFSSHLNIWTYGTFWCFCWWRPFRRLFCFWLWIRLISMSFVHTGVIWVLFMNEHQTRVCRSHYRGVFFRVTSSLYCWISNLDTLAHICWSRNSATSMLDLMVCFVINLLLLRNSIGIVSNSRLHETNITLFSVLNWPLWAR